MNSFCYQPDSSNKPKIYKTAVVPTTLHRIAHRCTEAKDQNHHKSFIFKILQHRQQDMVAVRSRVRKYKLRCSKNKLSQ